MKIEAIRVGLAEVPMRKAASSAVISGISATYNAVVEIHAEGCIGQGAALTLSPGQGAATAAMARDLAGLLLGSDAREVRAHFERMSHRLNLTGRSGIGYLALSALDTALWDLCAQGADLPLFRLLGAPRTALPVYAQPGWLGQPVEAVIDEALGFEQEGYFHYKMRVGSRAWREDVERVRKVREALSPRTRLLVDANQGWTRNEALAATRALDEFGLFWIEEPVDANDFEGNARVAAAINTPIAGGENAFGPTGMQSLIEHGSASVLMADLQHCGGPTGFLRVGEQIRLANIALSNHLFTEVSIHLLGCFPNALVVEHMPGWWDDLYEEPLGVVNGLIEPPETPGIGHRFSQAVRSTLSD